MSTRKCVFYSDLLVMDISRNLLLIMSNMIYVARNNNLMCLLNFKYPVLLRRRRIYILNRFNDLWTNSF